MLSSRWVVAMPINVNPPKYALMVNAIQERIEDGTYPPGTAIPSEAQLGAEFKASRPVVVRALGILQQDGWIESEQGKGRFVRSKAAMASRTAPNQAASLINQEDGADVQVLKAGPVLAVGRVAAVLELAEGTPVIARQRLVVSVSGPIELTTSYVPVELASGTGISDGDAIPEGLLQRISLRKGIEFDHATERIGARRASKEEAELLKVDNKECMLSVAFTAFDRSGRPQVFVDVLIPSSRHELEDSFRLS